MRWRQRRAHSSPQLLSTFRSRPSDARNNENSPIWASAIAAAESAVLNGYFITQTNRKATSGFPTRAPMARTRIARAGRGHQRTGIEQHADRDEEQHREGIAHRQRFGCRTQAVHQTAGPPPISREERAERHRDAEDQR